MSDLKRNIDMLITQRSKSIAEKIVDKQYELQPAFWKPYGSEGRKISIRDAGYHLPFLTEAILASDPQIFKDYVAWVKTLFHSLNFPDAVMIKTLECTREVLNNELPSDLAALTARYIEYGIEQMNEEEVANVSFINEAENLGGLAKTYMNYLLQGNRAEASKLILAEVQKGTSIKNIYLEVFQKSQYEIGRLWLTNQISIAQEHYCSAASQMIISQLYPYIFSTGRNGHRFVAACIGGELHEMGIRMVADFFEMDGWDTYYLGANTPTSAIIKALRDYNAEVLGLSIAMPYHQSLLKDTIEAVRASEIGQHLKIMIGGNAINPKNVSLSYFGADAFAPNAQKAVEVANSLIYPQN